MATSPVATEEQRQSALKFVAEFQKALLPAKLADTHENGAMLAIEVNKRGLPYTVENLVRVVNEILFERKLTWTVEPAKLQARKDNTAIQNKNDAQKDVTAFAAKVKAGEVADAHAKSEAEAEKATIASITSFFPISKRGQLDHAKQSEVQKLLADYVAKEKARGVGMKFVQEKVTAEIRRQYEIQERSAERV